MLLLSDYKLLMSVCVSDGASSSGNVLRTSANFFPNGQGGRWGCGGPEVDRRQRPWPSPFALPVTVLVSRVRPPGEVEAGMVLRYRRRCGYAGRVGSLPPEVDDLTELGVEPGSGGSEVCVTLRAACKAVFLALQHSRVKGVGSASLAMIYGRQLGIGH